MKIVKKKMCNYSALISDIFATMKKQHILEKIVKRHSMSFPASSKKKDIIESLRKEVGDEKILEKFSQDDLRFFCQEKNISGYTTKRTKEKLRDFIVARYTDIDTRSKETTSPPCAEETGSNFETCTTSSSHLSDRSPPQKRIIDLLKEILSDNLTLPEDERNEALKMLVETQLYILREGL